MILEPVQTRVLFGNFGGQFGKIWYCRQGFDVEQAGPQAVVDVMAIVGNVVGNCRRLPLGAGLRGKIEPVALVIIENTLRDGPPGIGATWRPIGIDERAIVFDQALEGLPSQVQPVKGRVAALQTGNHPQSMCIVVEAAETFEAGVESIFANMAKGRVTEIVGKRDRLGQIVIEP